jgi:hypothetical protein
MVAACWRAGGVSTRTRPTTAPRPGSPQLLQGLQTRPPRATTRHGNVDGLPAQSLCCLTGGLLPTSASQPANDLTGICVIQGHPRGPAPLTDYRRLSYSPARVWRAREDR